MLVVVVYHFYDMCTVVFSYSSRSMPCNDMSCNAETVRVHLCMNRNETCCSLNEVMM